MQSKFAYTHPEPMHMQKKLQKYVQNTCCILIYMFLGPRISKIQPKISFTCPGPVHMQKIAKMCAKYMLYIDLYVFGAKNFKNATKTFIHLPRACAHAKKNRKNVCKIHVSFIESIQFFIINSLFDSSAILFKHSFLIIVYTSPFYFQTLKKIACSLFSYFICLNN